MSAADEAAAEGTASSSPPTGRPNTISMQGGEARSSGAEAKSGHSNNVSDKIGRKVTDLNDAGVVQPDGSGKFINAGQALVSEDSENKNMTEQTGRAAIVAKDGITSKEGSLPGRPAIGGAAVDTNNGGSYEFGAGGEIPSTSSRPLPFSTLSTEDKYRNGIYTQHNDKRKMLLKDRTQHSVPQASLGTGAADSHQPGLYGPNIPLLRNGGAGNNTNENPDPSSSQGSSNADVIDSALLSALCDPRERFGLLRLEQTLVDFMREKTKGYIEVGGPNNSIVIGMQNYSSVRLGDAVDDGSNPLPGGGSQGNERGGRQTSFQRLCLHRLADRFNIVRESASSAGDGDGYGSSNGIYYPGLIRLVKVKHSRIPQKLLIDVDVSAFSDENGQVGRHYQRGGFLRDSGDTGEDGGVRGITHSISATSLTEGSKPVAGLRQHPKMMIMKRSSSNLGSSGSLKGKEGGGVGSNSKGREGVGRNGLKGKNLTDKEKAYAEARARIFNESIGDCGEDDQDGSDKGAGTGSPSVSTDPSPSTTPPPQSSSVVSPSSPSTSDVGTASSAEDVSSSQRAQCQDTSTSGERTRGSWQNYSSTIRPAAVKCSGVSKVTWRNRKQEESDPDFRRRTTVRVPVTNFAPNGFVGSMHGTEHMTATPYGAPMGVVSMQAAGSCATGTYGDLGLPSSSMAPSAPTPGSSPGVQQHYRDGYLGATQQVSMPSMSPASVPKGGTTYHQQHYTQQQYYSQTTTATSAMGGQAVQQYFSADANSGRLHHKVSSFGVPHNHLQQHTQAQAAAAAYYAQQHAAAYYSQAQHHNHHQQHIRGHDPSSSGVQSKKYHPVQQRRSVAGRGYEQYENIQTKASRYGGGNSSGKVIYGYTHHGSDTNIRGRGGAGGATAVAAAAANVHSMEEFPVLR